MDWISIGPTVFLGLEQPQIFHLWWAIRTPEHQVIFCLQANLKLQPPNRATTHPGFETQSYLNISMHYSLDRIQNLSKSKLTMNYSYYERSTNKFLP